ncbi:MAG: hypothetical protein GXP10_10740 [Gammaproteobacteria bacterium]|nr:hypothetical protein [Gammaproteobacteria bacterium]
MKNSLTAILTLFCFAIVAAIQLLFDGNNEYRNFKTIQSPDLRFVVMADIQLGYAANDKNLVYEARRFKRAIRAANALQPAFVIVIGDMINIPADAHQTAHFKRIAAQLDPAIPLYIAAGNHEVGDEPTPRLLQWYRDTFGDDWYAFKADSLHAIVLNSNIMHHPNAVPNEADKQLAWLTNELLHTTEKRSTQLIIFQHHPLYTKEPTEDESYYNLPMPIRQQYMRLYEKFAVDAVFAGHYHRYSVGRENPYKMVTSGAVGRPQGKGQSGFMVVDIVNGEITQRYVPL